MTLFQETHIELGEITPHGEKIWVRKKDSTFHEKQRCTFFLKQLYSNFW